MARKASEDLTELDRVIIGPAKRIDIPLKDKFVLRQIADLFRGLATVMDFESRRPDRSQREALFRIREEINHTNRKIKYAVKQAEIGRSESRDSRP